MKPSPLELKTAKLMRSSIISGKWPCGVKIPPYSRLEKMFPVSRVTLHRAVTRLQREGFLNGIERKGVYVAENPPHLKRIALLLSSPEKHNRFAAILAKDSAVIASQRGYEMVILAHQNRAFYEVEEAEKLRNELALNRYAGMIVSFEPEGSPLPSIFDTGIPKVYMTSGSHKDGFTVTLDNKTLAYNAMKRLKENGAKRVAILAYGRDNPILQHARSMLSEFGFESRPEWVLGIQNEELTEPITRLMFATGRGQRPDGLFIADDNFTEYVAHGIIACGIKVPGELKIISHCNWSMPPRRLVPMELIGFDSRKIISEGIRLIEAFHNKKKTASTLLLPPLMKSEATI